MSDEKFNKIINYKNFERSFKDVIIFDLTTMGMVISVLEHIWWLFVGIFLFDLLVQMIDYVSDEGEE